MTPSQHIDLLLASTEPLTPAYLHGIPVDLLRAALSETRERIERVKPLEKLAGVLSAELETR